MASPTPMYPWDNWLSKNKLKLKQGKHFYCAPYIFAQQVRNAAIKHEVAVSVHVFDDYIIMERS